MKQCLILCVLAVSLAIPHLAGAEEGKITLNSQEVEGQDASLEHVFKISLSFPVGLALSYVYDELLSFEVGAHGFYWEDLSWSAYSKAGLSILDFDWRDSNSTGWFYSTSLAFGAFYRHLTMSPDGHDEFQNDLAIFQTVSFDFTYYSEGGNGFSTALDLGVSETLDREEEADEQYDSFNDSTVQPYLLFRIGYVL